MTLTLLPPTPDRPAAGNVVLEPARSRKRLLRALLATLAAFSWPVTALADVAIIVSRDSPLQAIERSELTDLYLGRTGSIRRGEQQIGVHLVEPPAGSRLREAFYQALTGMHIERVNSYWARLHFSGAVQPPLPQPSNRAVVEAVGRDRYAIGYVDAEDVDASVRIVHLIDE